MPDDELALVATDDLIRELIRRSAVCSIVMRPLARDPEFDHWHAIGVDGHTGPINTEDADRVTALMVRAMVKMLSPEPVNGKSE